MFIWQDVWDVLTFGVWRKLEAVWGATSFGKSPFFIKSPLFYGPFSTVFFDFRWVSPLCGVWCWSPMENGTPHFEWDTSFWSSNSWSILSGKAMISYDSMWQCGMVHSWVYQKKSLYHRGSRMLSSCSLRRLGTIGWYGDEQHPCHLRSSIDVKTKVKISYQGLWLLWHYL